MSTLDDYIAAIDQLVQGEIPLADIDKILAVSKAMKEHSKNKPREVAQDLDGDGGFDYALSILTNWSSGFSVIKTVEYPVDDTDQNADILQNDEWEIYEKPSGKVLRFLEISPDSDEDMRITYTALHTCTQSGCTVDDFDEEAVQWLAASHFCHMLAIYYSQEQDSTIGADSIDHKSKSGEYNRRAKTLKAEYYDHMGIIPGKAPAASVSRDTDRKPSWRTDHMTHRRKYR